MILRGKSERARQKERKTRSTEGAKNTTFINKVGLQARKQASKRISKQACKQARQKESKTERQKEQKRYDTPFINEVG